MHVSYRRDDARRRVELVLEGVFDADAIIDTRRRQYREGGTTRGCRTRGV